MNSKKKSELKNTPTSVEQLDNMNSNSEIIKIHEIKNTPFAVIETENQYFGVLGNHRITKPYETLEEALEETKKMNWDRVMQVIWAVVEKFTKININDLN